MSSQSISRRDFLHTVGAGTLGTALAPSMAGAAGSTGPRPNILLIMVDDLGYADLSSYGAEDVKTPHIDRMVAAGMRMDPFYANCPVCSPTRASLLTGRFPDLVGVPGVIRTKRHQNFGHLAPEAVLLPTVLKRAGYRTAHIGKWHLGLGSPNTPNERGFDHFKGWLGDMMDDYYKHRRHGINYMRENDRVIDPKGHATDLFTEWTIDYLKEQPGRQEPFFLYLAYNAPHSPIQPPTAWVQRVKRRHPSMTDKRAKLVALVEHMDDGIGKVMAALRECGLDKSTLVIFTSDNGGSLHFGSNNDPFRGGKQNMWEGGLRVPTCAVWPGRIKPGSATSRIGMTMDLFPTVCEAAGAGFDHTIEGRSLLSTLLGKTQPWPERDLFWVRLEGGKRYKGEPYYAARRGPWKLLQNTAFEPLRLFNVEQDPDESEPLPTDHPKHRELHQKLRQHIARAAQVPWQRPGSE